MGILHRMGLRIRGIWNITGMGYHKAGICCLEFYGARIFRRWEFYTTVIVGLGIIVLETDRNGTLLGRTFNTVVWKGLD